MMQEVAAFEAARRPAGCQLPSRR